MDVEKFSSLRDVEEIVCPEGALPLLEKEMQSIVNRVRQGCRFAVVKPVAGLTFREQLSVPWLMAHFLGHPLAQNEA